MTIDELQALILNLNGLNEDQIKAEARQIYFDLCDESHQRGTILTHDGIQVLFYKDRFDHGFYTSSDRIMYPNAKDILAVKRIERIRWIRELVGGNVEGSECWEVERLDKKSYPPTRIYLLRNSPFIVWLDEISHGHTFHFRYSSAYPTMAKDLRRYCRNGRAIWIHKAQKNTP